MIVLGSDFKKLLSYLHENVRRANYFWRVTLIGSMAKTIILVITMTTYPHYKGITETMIIIKRESGFKKIP